jgi:hypothetical protein
LVEQLICNQQVVGSNPTAGSLVKRAVSDIAESCAWTLLGHFCDSGSINRASFAMLQLMPKKRRQKRERANPKPKPDPRQAKPDVSYSHRPDIGREASVASHADASQIETARKLFAKMPREVFDLWILPGIEFYGWPFSSVSERTVGTRWERFFACQPMSFWADAVWQLLTIPAKKHVFHS